MSESIVIMGVAGCGKSSLGASVAEAAGLRLIEGDQFHSLDALAKMKRGVALLDADREGWLARLGAELADSEQVGEQVVLTCSALKRSYREQLRRAAPGLRFVYLDIGQSQALARVAARAAEHFFSSSLVDSQFATLESPVGEAGVLQVDANLPLSELVLRVRAWLSLNRQALKDAA
jgi:gluconokinase